MLPRQHRLPLSSENSRLQQTGRRFQSSLLTLLVANRDDNSEPTRFAVVVSKKLDKRATRRNRTKRLLREALRMLLPQFLPGYDVVMYAKKIFWEEKVSDIWSEVEKLLKRAGLVKENSSESKIEHFKS